MKKFFTLCLSLMTGCLAVGAQDIDETFQFTDADGNVIPNGTVWVCNNVEDDYMGIPGNKFLDSGVYVKNTSGTAAFVGVKGSIVSITNASLSVCCLGTCESFSAPTSFTRPGTAGPASYFESITTEMFPNGDVASCELELQLLKYDNVGGQAGPTGTPGSKITILFTTDPTAGVDGVTVAGSSEEVARYTLDGRRLTAPQKGVNIVKYADGRTVKVIEK